MFKTFLFASCILLFAGNAIAYDAFKLNIRTELPDNKNTIGAAAEYYADSVGFRLITENPAPEESSYIAGQKLRPGSHIKAVMSIEKAILNLLPEQYVLVIDNKNKLFSFENKGEK